MPGRWSVVGVTVVGGWSVGGGFVLRRTGPRMLCLYTSEVNNGSYRSGQEFQFPYASFEVCQV